MLRPVFICWDRVICAVGCVELPLFWALQLLGF